MEKFGLFDLIEKFNAASNGKNDFSKSNASPIRESSTTSAATRPNLKDPDFNVPPQYAMNSKMTAYVKRHDELKASIRATVNRPRGRKKKNASIQIPRPTATDSPNVTESDVLTPME